MKTNIAIASLFMVGCAASSPPPSYIELNELDLPERAYSTPMQQVCDTLGELLEETVRRARADGFSQDQSNQIVVMAGVRASEGDELFAQRFAIAGIMVVNHVYSGRMDSVSERCVNEMWPASIIQATL